MTAKDLAYTALKNNAAGLKSSGTSNFMPALLENLYKSAEESGVDAVGSFPAGITNTVDSFRNEVNEIVKHFEKIK
jgi:hypothetical protein